MSSTVKDSVVHLSQPSYVVVNTGKYEVRIVADRWEFENENDLYIYLGDKLVRRFEYGKWASVGSYGEPIEDGGMPELDAV